MQIETFFFFFGGGGRDSFFVADADTYYKSHNNSLQLRAGNITDKNSFGHNLLFITDTDTKRYYVLGGPRIISRGFYSKAFLNPPKLFSNYFCYDSKRGGERTKILASRHQKTVPSKTWNNLQLLLAQNRTLFWPWVAVTTS